MASSGMVTGQKTHAVSSAGTCSIGPALGLLRENCLDLHSILQPSLTTRLSRSSFK